MLEPFGPPLFDQIDDNALAIGLFFVVCARAVFVGPVDVPAIARVDILTFADAKAHGRPMNLGVNARAAWHFTATALLEVQIEFDLGHLGILVMTVSLQGSRYDLTPVKPNHRLQEHLI